MATKYKYTFKIRCNIDFADDFEDAIAESRFPLEDVKFRSTVWSQIKIHI